jgi:CRP/FNR family transcriptional regulator, cyclic AMP receptor protein
LQQFREVSLIERFQGKQGEIALRDALMNQRLVLGSEALTAELSRDIELIATTSGQELIEQGESDNQVYLLLAGRVEVIVNGRKVGERGPGDHVGEMAAILPSLRRSATVRVVEPGVAAKVSATRLAQLGDRYPTIWRQISKTLAERLYQRNALVATTNKQSRVFIISSAEALPIARAVQESFLHDPFSITIWTDGVFRASQYPVESLVHQLDASDFAVAIAQADDFVVTREVLRAMPRDNVLFELGMFIGRLGRHRSFLLEPLKEGIQLPSDLSGITTIPYKAGLEKELLSLVGPACNQLRRLFNEVGPR